MSHIGEQLVAPNGYRGLYADRVYHHLGRAKDTNSVLLIFFTENPPRAHVEKLSCGYFEEGLITNEIVAKKEHLTLPPWLSNYEGKDLKYIDEKNTKRKIKLLDRANERLEKIQFLLNKKTEVISSDEPDVYINKLTRQESASLNETRVRLWFFSYLCFGRNLMSLLPPCKNNGKWEREKHPGNKKFGCPSIAKGKNSGFRVSSNMKKEIYKGYRRFKGQGVNMVTIYADSMNKIFKCKQRKSSKDSMEFYHPEGQPFPTLVQFTYWIYKEFGKDNVHLELYGQVRTRNRLSASKGRFSESVANLVEHIEGDGYYLKEVPKGSRDGELMPPLCVVRLRDTLSGFFVGIGFSIGAENSDAYRTALFSMAISKVKFCQLFGINIEADEWPSVGMPSYYTFDRGPGAVDNIIQDLENRIPVRELAPSYSGQSKSTIESSHPRTVVSEGKPFHVASNLTYVQLAKREIMRTLRDNQRSDVSERLTSELIKEIEVPVPLSVWNFFDKRMRTDAHPLPFDVAVRNLLVRLEFTVQKDGVYLEGQRYDSGELREAGMCERVINKGHYTVDGYIYPLSVRQGWIESNGRIAEVKAILPIRDNDEQLYISLEELKELNKIRSKMNSTMREHRQAVNAEYRERFEYDSGVGWDSGTRKSGRAKRGTVAARSEFADVKKLTASGKRR